jgi:hypothetical protein
MYNIEGKKIIFEDNKLFSMLPSLGYGSQGDVYKFRLDKEFYALKVFNGLNIEYLENYEQKLNINIDSYVSPIKLLYVKDKFKGYLMKYCKGKDLQMRPKLDITVSEFASSTVKLFEDTKKLTDLKYVIYDTFISNVMYDEGFKMIDIDNYPYELNKSLSEIDELNRLRLNKMLVTIFINTTGLASLAYTDVEFTKLLDKCTSGNIGFEELFNDLCMKAYNVADKEIEKVEDIGKVLKNIRK